MLIEDASERDIPQLTAIYNDIVATSTAVFSEEPVSVESRCSWLRARRDADRPVIVAAGDRCGEPGFTATPRAVRLRAGRAHARDRS
jgi:L-amino acid N-acyltransferase